MGVFSSEENKTIGFGFGKLILRARKSKDWSLARLAEQTEKVGYRLSESYLNRLENGKRTEPSISSVMVLIEALGLSLKEVFESLKMEHIYERAVHGDMSIVLPDDLNKFEMAVATENGNIPLSKAQKQLIGQIIVDLYEITLHSEPTYFEEKAVGYVLRLGETLEKELYSIEVEDQGFKLIFDIKVMVEKYNLRKEEIKSSLERINIKALYNADISVPLPILEEYWATKREKDTLLIIDKVSETLKPFINPY